MADFANMPVEEMVKLLDDPKAIEKILADSTAANPPAPGAPPPASPSDMTEYTPPGLGAAAPAEGEEYLPPGLRPGTDAGELPPIPTSAPDAITPPNIMADIIKSAQGFIKETAMAPVTFAKGAAQDVQMFHALGETMGWGNAARTWGNEFRAKMGLPVSKAEEDDLAASVASYKLAHKDDPDMVKYTSLIDDIQRDHLTETELKELRRGMVNIGSFALPVGGSAKAIASAIPNHLLRRIAQAEMHSIASFTAWEVGTAIANEEGRGGITEAAKEGVVLGALTPPVFKVLGKTLGGGFKLAGASGKAMAEVASPYLRAADTAAMKVRVYAATRHFLNKVWDQNALAGETLLRKSGLDNLADTLVAARGNTQLRAARWHARVDAAWHGFNKEERLLLGSYLEGLVTDAELSSKTSIAAAMRVRAEEIQAVTAEIRDMASSIGLPHYDPASQTLHRFVPRGEYGIPHYYVDTMQYVRPGKVRDESLRVLQADHKMSLTQAENFLDTMHRRNIGEVQQVIEGKRTITGSVAVIGRKYNLPGYELDPREVLPTYIMQMSRRIENHLRFSDLPAGLRPSTAEELAASLKVGPKTPVQGPLHPETAKPELPAGELQVGDTVYSTTDGVPVRVKEVHADGSVSVRFPDSPVDTKLALGHDYTRFDPGPMKGEPLPGPGKWHAVTDFADDMIAAAEERIRQRNAGKVMSFTGFIDPADIVDIVQIGAGHMLKGAVGLAEWGEKMVAQFGNTIKPHLDGLYKQANEVFESRRPRGNDEVRRIADVYMRETGQGPIHVLTEHPPLDESLGARVAREYNRRASKPTDLKVRAAYKAFVDETRAQFEAIKKAGYTFEPFDGPDPYGTVAREMMNDLRANKRLKVYAGALDHPVLTPEENWMFRAVHDFFGHSREGYDFGPKGENAAFLAHAHMYSRKAIPAMATETRGQNSWVNFFGDNPKLPVKERPYAEQKATLMPEWVYADALSLKNRPKAHVAAGSPKLPSEGVSNERTAARLAGAAQARPVHDPIEMQLNAFNDGLAGTVEHIKQNPEAVSFYHADLDKAMETSLKVYPELQDPAKMGIFKLLLAGSSQASKPVDNFAYTVHMWDRYRETGKVPFLSRASKELGVFGRTLAGKVNELVKEAGSEANAVAVLLSKDGQGTYNAVNMFGPKIGSFWLNVMGVHDAVTVDRWMMRWYRRINGRPFDKTGAIADVPTDQEYKEITEAVRRIAGETGMQPDQVQALLWDREKRIWHAAGARDSGTMGFAGASELVFKNREDYTRQAFGERVPGQKEMF